MLLVLFINALRCAATKNSLIKPDENMTASRPDRVVASLESHESENAEQGLTRNWVEVNMVLGSLGIRRGSFCVCGGVNECGVSEVVKEDGVKEFGLLGFECALLWRRKYSENTIRRRMVVWRKLQTRMDEEEVANMTSDFQHKSGSVGVKYTIQP